MRFSVDGWDPTYGTSLELEDYLGESTASVEVNISMMPLLSMEASALIRLKVWLFLIALVVLPVVRAEVSLPVVFSDGMLLQRDLPIHVWGRSAPAENVSATFRGETRAAVADDLGRWQLYLPPAAAGGPYELTISGSNRIVIHNVLVGDVWIASGQSNMEFKMRELDNPQAEIAAAKFPRIRIMRIKHAYSDYPLTDAVADQRWAEVSPESVPEFSAVAYYFAREIHQKEKVPIGIIESNWGGTVAETWTSMDALTADASLMPVFASRARMMDAEAENLLLEPVHQAEIAKAKAAGLPPPKFPWHPLQQMWAPAQLYNAMIAPLTPYAIRGVIWYQGESNSKLDRAPSYERLFQTMIRDWRDHWALGDFPFLYVQISSFTSDATEDWAIIRQAQLRALQLRNTAMAVTIDIGNPDDVHPRRQGRCRPSTGAGGAGDGVRRGRSSIQGRSSGRSRKRIARCGCGSIMARDCSRRAVRRPASRSLALMANSFPQKRTSMGRVS